MKFTGCFLFSGVPLEERCCSSARATGVYAPKRIYVIGGWNYNVNPSNLNQVYDPASSTWTTGAPMPTARDGLCVAVVDDALYAIGGTVRTRNERYTPAQYKVPTSPSPLPSQEPVKPASTEPQQKGLSPEAGVIVAAVTAVVLGAGLLVYFRKRKR